MGSDSLIDAGLLHGPAGAIASTANIPPKIVAGIDDAFMAGDNVRALELQRRLDPLRRLVASATFPVVLKEGRTARRGGRGWLVLRARPRDRRGTRAELARVVADLNA